MDKYHNIFVKTLGLEQNFVPEDIVRGKITNWDSIGHITLITKIEEAYNILFDTKDILQFSSYLSGIDILKKNGAILRLYGEGK